ncbi:predicted protein [Sclerotinia sclerotiorum 1980 UF-70]|uniref:Uncharacterized protein n=1 Tax=Sclerotinia sclerotiorum (strain ATCC 18683 / 1980 / Ss-1) TaxID=665079 RepID=A7F4E8_SCLS1|nr:predicted protein [Sclerotinia sclerotiorum 1980 UF-70]EDN97619.1 predicted protein [Sclerotinia sclerotiorum 1980 UF-70]
MVLCVEEMVVTGIIVLNYQFVEDQLDFWDMVIQTLRVFLRLQFLSGIRYKEKKQEAKDKKQEDQTT